MAAPKVALRALQAQTEFDVVGKAAELAAAAVERAEVERRAEQAAARCIAVLDELRRLQALTAINTVAVESVRRTYRQAVERRVALHARKAEALHAEDVLRDALAGLRHRARNLGRAAHDAAAAEASSRAAHEHATLDDLWLAGRRRTTAP